MQGGGNIPTFSCSWLKGPGWLCSSGANSSGVSKLWERRRGYHPQTAKQKFYLDQLGELMGITKSKQYWLMFVYLIQTKQLALVEGLQKHLYRMDYSHTSLVSKMKSRQTILGNIAWWFDLKNILAAESQATSGTAGKRSQKPVLSIRKHSVLQGKPKS